MTGIDNDVMNINKFNNIKDMIHNYEDNSNEFNENISLFLNKSYKENFIKSSIKGSAFDESNINIRNNSK